METQASLVVPKDDGEIEMFVSTQNPNKTQVRCYSYCESSTILHTYLTQLLAAKALGIQAHKVLTRVKRLGMA